MFTILEISHTHNLRSSVTIRRILLIISDIVASEGYPERILAFMLVRPNINSCIQFLTVVFDGADVPLYLSSFSLASLAVFSLK